MIGIGEPFQRRVRIWMLRCFGPVISDDGRERNHRFLEEALELVQALGCTEAEATHLVRYVYGRPAGAPPQEVGGVMVTLAALCTAQNMDMDLCGEEELSRVWRNIERIRAKQAAKPKDSPLPGNIQSGMTCGEPWRGPHRDTDPEIYCELQLGHGGNHVFGSEERAVSWPRGRA